jgi:hypothetical protein
MSDPTGTIPSEGEHDPLHHTRKMRQSLKQISDHMREDIGKFEEPQAKAMFETSADVIDGIITAFDQYEVKSEKGWKA